MNDISFREIKKGNTKVFQYVFNELFEDLSRYAFLFLKDKDLSKEIVQELFINLWEKRKTLNITGSIKSYLFKACRNSCLNHINRSKKTERLDDIYDILETNILHEFSEFEGMDFEFLKQQIELAVESLPPKCKEIFILSRENNLTYSQISDELQISKKTVENQMGIALKKLKEKLSPILFIFVWYF